MVTLRTMFSHSIAFLLLCISLVDGIFFHIAEKEKRCFIEELPNETQFVGRYKVQLYDSNSKNYSDNPNIGMHIQVKDAKYKVVLSKFYANEGVFSFTSHIPGKYEICLHTNSSSGFNGAQLRVYVSFDVGERAQDYQKLAAAEKLNELQLRVRQIFDQLEQINKEQDYQRYREERFRDISENINSRVLVWSAVQVVVLLATGFWQMRHLKKFFEAKKLV